MHLLALTTHLVSDVLGHARELHPAEVHAQAAMDWLCRAHDAGPDGGVPLRYSMLKGWDASYPETTGYIIPTFFLYAAHTGKDEYFQRAVRMAEWELSIQQADGSFNGGAVGSGYGSFVFDTGQIVFGLLAAHKATGKDHFLEGALRAGAWLTQVQDPDGAWRRYTFNAIPHVYYTRVAWALAKLGVYVNDHSYTRAARLNVDWALTSQQKNGWFDHAGFTETAHAAPYTHTIAYTIRGILETGLLLDDPHYLDAARQSADVLATVIRSDGSYADTYHRDWRSPSSVSCLTGNAQIAIILLRLSQNRSNADYTQAAQKAARFLCRRQSLIGPPETRGAIAGSYPIWGRYQRFAFPNWATKFFVDLLLLEKGIH